MIVLAVCWIRHALTLMFEVGAGFGKPYGPIEYFSIRQLTRFISGVTFSSQLHMGLPKIMTSYKNE